MRQRDCGPSVRGIDRAGDIPATSAHITKARLIFRSTRPSSSSASKTRIEVFSPSYDAPFQYPKRVHPFTCRYPLAVRTLLQYTHRLMRGVTKKPKITTTALVRSAKANGHERVLRLTSDAGGEIRLPRFSLVGKDDELHFGGLNNKRIWLVSPEDPDRPIPVLPTFHQASKISIGSRQFQLTVSEIDSAEKMTAHQLLERFHYRSNPSLIEHDDVSKDSGSRRAVLVASIETGSRAEFVGYIELGMPLMMVAPRHRAFNRPFKHSTRDIAWAQWSQSGLRHNLNLIVRITRVVTHPTFRGVGLARELISAAEDFARSRWHIKYRRPIFIEISAEMLNYFDFVAGSGYTYCGHTTGNRQRLAADMKAMSKGQKIGSGIMTLQKKYFENLKIFAKQKDISLEQAITFVGAIATNDDPLAEIPPDSYLTLRKLFRLPRPYYIKGLDLDAKRYLEGFSIQNPHVRSPAPRRHSTTVHIKGLKVSAEISLPESQNVRAIKNAFGLEGSTIRQVLLDIPEFSANSGSVHLFSGASGTGKSIFIDVLGSKSRPLPNNLTLEYEKCSLADSSLFEEIDNDTVVIDFFADRFGLRKSLETLARVGLSEAVPLVKPYWMLSKGQKYRVRLAELICRNSPVWLLDEFGADLDPITASVVATSLRRLASSLGVIVFVAAANNSHFLRSLQPTSVLRFDLGVSPRYLKAAEYENELL